MKPRELFCKRCIKTTKHLTSKQVEGGYRIFSAIFTLGMHEAVNKTIYTCSNCGKETYK